MYTLTRKQGVDRSQSRPLPLDFVRIITDDTGMIQHAVGGVPDPHTGYTVDDNARAFLAMVRLWRRDIGRRSETEPLLRRYLQFLLYAQRRENTPIDTCGGSGDGVNGDGWFRNFAGYDRRFLEARGSEDSLGRCIWALGEAADGDLPAGTRLAVQGMLSRARIAAESLTAPHATVYMLLGLSGLAKDSGIRPLVEKGVERLLALWDTYSTRTWRWFEPKMTYDCARFCEALLRAGIALDNDRAINVAKQAMDFLTEHSFDKKNGYLAPIGCRGWWREGQPKATFDQQTIEAGAYVEGYRIFEHVFGDRIYAKCAVRSQEWFWGDNVHRLPLYDPDSGGCYDGLTADGVNLNMGAESVLSYLLAEGCAFH